MALIDLTATQSFPHYEKVTTGSTAGNVRRINLPAGVPLRVSVQPIGAAGKVTTADLADDAALGSNAYFQAADGAILFEDFAGGSTSKAHICVASAGSSGTIMVGLSRRED